MISSIESGSAIITLVRALLCVDLLFTAPMLLAIGREIVEVSMFSAGFSFTIHYPETSRNILRTLIVFTIVGAAYAVNTYAANAFYNVVSLVGGICGFTLGFIFPPLMYLRVFWDDLVLPTKLFNMLIIALGSVLLVASTISTVQAF